ncbi:MAG: protein containing YHS domain protein [Candidatus Omnitrophica bacterium CG11_big_fil_rev_8_21_14_0_20_63_9]|nr:MAG: protein containing YHS domain protein [Candidatus Omnitrophica bacterium CG11_big_fil_rev_8_21_14_0_20_63_9]
MLMKIGVMGGATGDFAKDHLDKAHRLGEAIARRGCLLITGGCPGLPHAAACGAKQAGGFVVGISPGLSLDEHINKYGSPAEFHDVLIYTGSGLMGREVVNIRSSDIVIIIGGRSGTLGELAIAYDEGKLIGVLTGTGGVSDLVKDILEACEKDTGARVVYDAQPERLIEELLRVYEQEHFRRPSVFSGPEAHPNQQQDVVCGMWIAPGAVVAQRTVQGKTYVFCSTACADQFDARHTKQ